MSEALNFTAQCGPFEIEAASGDKPGLARTKILAYTGGQMNVPGFHLPVVIDLSGVSVPTKKVPLLKDHDPTKIVGHSEDVEVSARRISLDGTVSGTGLDAGEVKGLAANGFPWQASVGMSVEQREFVSAGQTVKVNGRNFPGPIIVARRTILKEVSFVALGADVHSSATVAAKLRSGSMDFESWIQAKGFDKDNLSDQQRTSLKAMFDAEHAPPPAPAPAPATPPAPAPAPTAAPPADHGRNLREIQAAAEAETGRINAINRMVGEIVAEHPELGTVLCPIGEEAIKANWTLEATRNQVELAQFKSSFPRAPGYVPTREPQVNDEVIVAALCQTAKLPNLEKHFGEQVLTAAHRSFKQLGLAEVIIRAAKRNGYDCVNLRNTKPALKAAFAEPEIRAGMAGPSTYSIPNIISNVANKFTAAGFMTVDQAWREISAINTVNDFKTRTGIALTTGSLMYDKVAKGGELKHGAIGETTYTNGADTYGRILGIDRKDLINDDLGALTGVARGMGRGAGLKLNDVFWTVFLNNTGSFFTSGNANITTGALSLTTLATTDSIFRVQTDPDGLPTGLVPKILLVPTGSRITALNMMNGTIVVATTTANAPVSATNSLAGAYKVVSSPYMSNTAYTGYSTTAYYLLADPNEMPVIETVFLNGVDSPTVETAELDFNTLGIAMRAWIDFGVALQEYRAGVRSTGA